MTEAGKGTVVLEKWRKAERNEDWDNPVEEALMEGLVVLDWLEREKRRYVEDPLGIVYEVEVYPQGAKLSEEVSVLICFADSFVGGDGDGNVCCRRSGSVRSIGERRFWVEGIVRSEVRLK
jgi:hypothetical protein